MPEKSNTLANLKPKYKIFLDVYQESRRVHLAKTLQMKKISCKCTFKELFTNKNNAISHETVLSLSAQLWPGGGAY
jgi:hypothetical protein